jgi:P-type Cu+ transporter
MKVRYNIEGKSCKVLGLKVGIALSHNNCYGECYCSMHCKRAKMYDNVGGCKFCDINLENVNVLSSVKKIFSCPIHSEIITDMPGKCPICGMDLVLIDPIEEKGITYIELIKKFK